MFNAGSLAFRLMTIGAQAFKQDQADAKKAVEETGNAAQSAAPKVDKLGTASDETGKKAKSSKAPLDEQAKSTNKVGEESDESSKKQKKQAESTQEQISAAKELAGAMTIAGAAIGALVGLAIAKNTEFDAAMSNVRAATMATAGEQRALGEAALDAGADTAYSASEAAAAQEELAKAGQSVSQIIGGSLNGALALAAAGQLQVARSAEIMATTLTQFRLPAEQAAHVSDVLASGAGKAQGSVDDLALALSYVGPLAGSVGFSLNETAGTIAYFATQGIIGEKAGTSLRGVLASLQSPSALAAGEMKKYGINMFDASGNMLSMAGIAEQLRTRLGGLTEQERLAALGRIFGNESLNAATLLYEGGAEKVNEWTDAVDDSGYAARQASMRQDNLAGDIEKLGGAFDTALIRTGSAANDVLRGMTQSITELVDMYGESPAPIQATALVLGVATAAALLFAGAAVGGRAKFLELKDALDKTSVGMKGTAIAGGLAGIALTGVLAVVGLIMSAQAEARQRAQSYADAIESGATRSSKAFAELADEALNANQKLFGVFDLGGDSAYEAADKLGISLGVVRDAALGSAPALRELQQVQEDIANSDSESLMEKYGFTVAEATMAEANINSVINAVKGNNDTIDEAIRLADLKSQADEESTATSKTSAEAYLEQADTVEDLNSQLSELIDKLFEANGINRDAITANSDYQEALADANEQVQNITNGVEGYARGLDLTTQSGRDNMDVLTELASRTEGVAKAQYEADHSVEGLQQRLAEGREALINTATQMGLTADEAVALADDILGIPEERISKIIADTTEAQNKVNSFITTNSGKQIPIKIVADGSGFKLPSGTVVSAPDYADGAVVTYHASGSVSENHVAQIARAGEMRVWAEPETGGEAYIPLAPSKRARSELIMTETASRMGGLFIPADARPYADGSAASPRSESIPLGDVNVYVTNKSGANLDDLIDIRVERAGRSRKIALSNGKQRKG